MIIASLDTYIRNSDSGVERKTRQLAKGHPGLTIKASFQPPSLSHNPCNGSLKPASVAHMTVFTSLINKEREGGEEETKVEREEKDGGKDEGGQGREIDR